MEEDGEDGADENENHCWSFSVVHEFQLASGQTLPKLTRIDEEEEEEEDLVRTGPRWSRLKAVAERCGRVREECGAAASLCGSIAEECKTSRRCIRDITDEWFPSPSPPGPPPSSLCCDERRCRISSAASAATTHCCPFYENALCLAQTRARTATVGLAAATAWIERAQRRFGVVLVRNAWMAWVFFAKWRRRHDNNGQRVDDNRRKKRAANLGFGIGSGLWIFEKE